MSEPIRDILPEAENKTNHVEHIPMRWHGFQIKFMLVAAAAVHILQTCWIFLGKIYYTDEIRRQVYAGIPNMRFVDYSLALCLLAAAFMQIIARSRLAKFHSSGVKLLLGAYIVLAAAQPAYAIARFLFTGLSPISIPIVGGLIAYTALAFINKTYYAKRRATFESRPQ